MLTKGRELAKESTGLDSQSTRYGRRASATAGVVLECNDRGVLISIRRDDLGLLHEITPGLFFHQLVARESLDKAFGFLSELKGRASAFGWELNLSLACQPTTLYMGGMDRGERLLIFGTRTQGGLLRFSRYFLDQSQYEADGGTLSADIPLPTFLNERELALQELLSCTQSQLDNLKRILAGKNARLQRVIEELQAAQAGLYILQNLLPICSSCKKIRDEQGLWHQVENYFKSRTGVKFTHSICPECAQNLYPGLSMEK